MPHAVRENTLSFWEIHQMEEMKADSEMEVSDARRRLGDERVLTFLRACRDY